MQPQSARRKRSRIALVRALLVAAALLSVVVAWSTPAGWGIALRLIVGWNVGAAFWLMSVAWLTFRLGPDDLARQAGQYDVGWAISLSIVTAAIMASLAAIAHILSGVKGLPFGEKAPHVAIALGTIALSWTSLHVLYALNYARHYFSSAGQDRDAEGGGLAFPGTRDPMFSDFFYFSFTIGATSQTSDVAILSSHIRRSATIHAGLSFLFNTAVLALTINIAAGLL